MILYRKHVKYLYMLNEIWVSELPNRYIKIHNIFRVSYELLGRVKMVLHPELPMRIWVWNNWHYENCASKNVYIGNYAIVQIKGL